MLPSSDALSKSIKRLYEAASNPASWGLFLRDVAETTRATSAALVMYDASQASFTLSSEWNVDPEATRLYGQHFGSVDVWAHRALSQRRSCVWISETLCPIQSLKRSEMYNDFLMGFGIEHGMFTIVENTGSRLASLSLYRDQSRTEFKDPDRELLEFLLPHIQQAVKIHSEFSKLRAEAQSITAAFDLLSNGVIFLGANGQVLFMNSAASSIISERDGLLATRLGIHAEQQGESAQLSRLIHEAISASMGKGLGAGGTVLVSRRAREPLRLQISPIRNAVIETPQRISAVVFVTDPARRRPQHELLRTFYRLTPAEIRVALLLVDGQSPQLIAESVGVTPNTVRTQIKSVYSKTGVRRQAELVRLLLDHTVVAGP